MRPNRNRRPALLLVLGTLLLGLAFSVPQSEAQTAARAMKWEFTIPITFTSSENFDGENGTSLDINSDVGWGFGFGWHMDNHWMFGMDFTWLDANYKANIAADTGLPDQIPDTLVSVSGTLDAANFQLVSQYNILDKPITPFVRANLGVTWVDSNIPSAPAQGVCWWDPWWGYICDTWQPTFEDSSFSYGAAVGLRADLQRGFFLEGSYNMLWVDFDKDTASFDGWRLTMGWIF